VDISRRYMIGNLGGIPEMMGHGLGIARAG